MIIRTAAILAMLVFLASGHAAHAQEGRESPYQTAVFAGGDFTAVESTFDRVKGVMDTMLGYVGPEKGNPTYQNVRNGGSGYRFAVKVMFDPKVVTYKQLLDVYWHIINPLDQGGQFCDRGTQYMSAIYFMNEEQRQQAIYSRLVVEDALGQRPATRITAMETFYMAEDYYQDFHKKENYRYNFTRGRCNRDQDLREVWGRQAIVEKD